MSLPPCCRLAMGTVRSCRSQRRPELSKSPLQLRRASSTNSSNTTSPTSCTASTPSTSTTTWQRSAQKVKNTDVSNQYLEHIRDMHDPSLHIKTLEEELLGSIGQALGKQGEKIDSCLRTMQKHLQTYQQALEDHNAKENHVQVVEAAALLAARAYNEARQQAIQARWELLVHRQAAGFLVDNHNHVTKLYPIGPALPVVVNNHDHDDETKTNKDDHKTKTKETTEKKETKKTSFGDQLDWWQRIGQWK